MKKLVLVGAGGHALSVIDSIRSKEEFDIIGLTGLSDPAGAQVAGYPILGDDSALWSLFDCGVNHAFVAVGSVGNPAPRRTLFLLLQTIGFLQPAILDCTSNLGRSVTLGAGVFAGTNTVIHSGSSVEDMTILNTGAIVEHGCHIGAFAHIGPGAVLCGDVTIGANTHIGANATILQGVTVGENTIIGAGSVVTRDIPSAVVAYGTPCKAVSANG